MNLSGAVLAGGRSSRFGRDKALHLYEGQTLLGWSLQGLAEADERFIVSNRPYPNFALPRTPDLIETGTSLSGLHAALSYARNDFVAVCACDLPHLSTAYWRALLAKVADKPVVPEHEDGRLEPLAAIYPKSFLPEVAAALLREQYGLQRLLRRTGFSNVSAEALRHQFGDRLFLNINRPEDLSER